MNPKALSITANNDSKTYGATATFAGTEFSAPRPVNSDTVTSVALTSTAGTCLCNSWRLRYCAECRSRYRVLGNYTISYANGTLSVNPAVLTVTANNQSIGLGDPDPAFTFVYSGFVNSDNLAVVTAAPTCTVSGAHSTAGTYPIVCSGWCRRQLQLHLRKRHTDSQRSRQPN